MFLRPSGRRAPAYSTRKNDVGFMNPGAVVLAPSINSFTRERSVGSKQIGNGEGAGIALIGWKICDCGKVLVQGSASQTCLNKVNVFIL